MTRHQGRTRALSDVLAECDKLFAGREVPDLSDAEFLTAVRLHDEAAQLGHVPPGAFIEQFMDRGEAMAHAQGRRTLDDILDEGMRRFFGRQPASLSDDEARVLLALLAEGARIGWLPPHDVVVAVLIRLAALLPDAQPPSGSSDRLAATP